MWRLDGGTRFTDKTVFRKQFSARVVNKLRHYIAVSISLERVYGIDNGNRDVNLG